jgi:hypothetical protein
LSIAIASSSSIEPWSTVRTPARIAALMPRAVGVGGDRAPAPGLVQGTHLLVRDCWAPGGIPFESTAPVTRILTKSAPCLKFVRTALRTSSGPSARLRTSGTSTYGENWRASPAPPVAET